MPQGPRHGPELSSEAIGPDEIRVALGAARYLVADLQADVGGTALVLAAAVDRYASLGMAPSTVEALRAAGSATMTAANRLDDAAWQLRSARDDFDARDGLVGQAVGEAGNLAEDAVLTQGGGGVNDAAAGPPVAQRAAVKRRARTSRWSAVDVLGVADEVSCWGSDVVPGTGAASTQLALMDYRGESDVPQAYVAVATVPRRYDPVSGRIDGGGRARSESYVAPHLSAGEAERAAATLDDLAALADSGYQPPPPTVYGRAAQRVQNMVTTEGLALTERIAVGSDEEFGLTVGQLLELLKLADPAGSDASLRRGVVARTVAREGGDSGTVWMYVSGGPVPTVAVVGVEGRGSPDEEFWLRYTAHHTSDDARRLADKLRVFAAGVRRRRRRS